MPTSGPIVRTGTTPEFWKNWDKVFAGKKGGSRKTAKKAGKQKKMIAAKTARKSTAKKGKGGARKK